MLLSNGASDWQSHARTFSTPSLQKRSVPVSFFLPRRWRSSWAERLLNWKAGLFAASVVQCQRQLGTFSLPAVWPECSMWSRVVPGFSTHRKRTHLGGMLSHWKLIFHDASWSCLLQNFLFDPQVKRYEQLPSWPQAESDFYARYAAISALEVPNHQGAATPFAAS